jgi:P-type E1-E2 ATPase
LTYGKPEVMEICPANGASAAAVIEAAAIAECQSEHPVAKAILSKASQMGISVRPPDRFDYTPGRGIVADAAGEEIVVGNWMHLREGRIDGAGGTHGTSDGAILVTRGGHFLGSVRVADLLRPEARTAVQDLKSAGLKTVLLTGDSKRIAESVGKGLDVDEICADLLPEQKLAYVRELLAQGRKPAMVGDGINDAPALAEATVGVAMGSGTDIARESSDIVLIGSDLSKFAKTIHIARRCRAIILQNFAGTLIVDALGIGLAAFGFLNPVLAALVHVCSELTFILNSARLLPSLRYRKA